jgi:hypothetical protein
VGREDLKYGQDTACEEHDKEQHKLKKREDDFLDQGDSSGPV